MKTEDIARIVAEVMEIITMIVVGSILVSTGVHIDNIFNIFKICATNLEKFLICGIIYLY